MAGTSAMMSRNEVISRSTSLEIGPNKTQTPSKEPDAGVKEGMSVDVCKNLHKY